MEKEIWKVIDLVGVGNPGAYTVIKELEWFTYWHELLRFCLKKGYVGSKLWELYKDEYNQDGNKLGHFLETEMFKDREYEHLANPQANNLPRYKI